MYIISSFFFSVFFNEISLSETPARIDDRNKNHLDMKRFIYLFFFIKKHRGLMANIVFTSLKKSR